MPLSKLTYTKDWRNPDDFPTYSSDETQIRADMQLLFDEACSALNKLIDDLDASEIPFAPTPEIQAADVRQALIAIQNQIAQIALGNLPDNSISSQKIKPGAVTEEKMADLSVTTRALEDKSISEPKLGDVSVSTRAIKDGAVTRDKMAVDAYNDKANLVNGRVAADELTRTVKYISESYTLVLDDLRKIVAVNPLGPVAVAIPGNVDAAFPVGAEIDILSRSDNDITIQGGSGVTLSGPITLLSNAGSKARLLKIGTNEWTISVDEKVTENGIENSAVTNAKIADGAVSAGKIASGAVQTAKIASGAVTRAKLAADVKVLAFTEKAVDASAWVSDTTYSDFPYRAAVACEGVTAKHYAELSFSPADAMSGSFAPVVESYDGGVYVYASEIPEAAVTIPTIVCTPVE